eukprot:TRINITY_DN181_c0_g1_i7.p1 TRINITY_DN181_c0_g1~~TRINITY_DN181_c0_g1_i7.p1  ORF type:complete len:576 (-),score=124.15 TRINITY_DN181_c0_g1_i7:4124-5851(-)
MLAELEELVSEQNLPRFASLSAALDPSDCDADDTLLWQYFRLLFGSDGLLAQVSAFRLKDRYFRESLLEFLNPDGPAFSLCQRLETQFVDRGFSFSSDVVPRCVRSFIHEHSGVGVSPDRPSSGRSFLRPSMLGSIPSNGSASPGSLGPPSSHWPSMSGANDFVWTGSPTQLFFLAFALFPYWRQASWSRRTADISLYNELVNNYMSHMVQEKSSFVGVSLSWFCILGSCFLCAPLEEGIHNMKLFVPAITSYLKGSVHLWKLVLESSLVHDLAVYRFVVWFRSIGGVLHRFMNRSSQKGDFTSWRLSCCVAFLDQLRIMGGDDATLVGFLLPVTRFLRDFPVLMMECIRANEDENIMADWIRAVRKFMKDKLECVRELEHNIRKKDFASDKWLAFHLRAMSENGVDGTTGLLTDPHLFRALMSAWGDVLEAIRSKEAAYNTSWKGILSPWSRSATYSKIDKSILRIMDFDDRVPHSPPMSASQRLGGPLSSPRSSREPRSPRIEDFVDVVPLHSKENKLRSPAGIPWDRIDTLDKWTTSFHAHTRIDLRLFASWKTWIVFCFVFAFLTLLRNRL